MKQEGENIEEQINDIVYFMPGMGWNDVWGASPDQRDKLIKLISKRLKEKSGNDDLI